MPDNFKKQRLELTWIGKNNPEYDIANIEPRILEEKPELSYGDSNTENMIIHGDNLLALKALLPEYEGKIKCAFIDPPYNTGSAFSHYDDSVEHSTWLSLMKPRLELLLLLLSEDGSLWITIDDNEAHYLKVLCDEVFGRSNFVTNLAWHKRISPANDAKFFSADFDHILVYAKQKEAWHPNRLEKSESQLANYKNPDNDSRGVWNSAAYTCAKTAEERPNLYYPIINPFTKKEIWPSKTRVWAYDRSTHEKNEKEGLLYWGKEGKGKMPRIKKFLSNSKPVVPRSLWSYEEAGHNQEARLEIDRLFPGSPFTTPKPERLLKRVLEVATDRNSLVLDSFLGSGTTTAVAHKMGRKYIGVELGDHAYTHVQTRMKKVVDGNDELKISELLDWKGGGGFKFYELAPSFIALDEFGNPVIDNYYNETRLIRAMCKLTGYTFAPSSTHYWKHGKGQGKNSIYVTTQMLSVAMVQQIVSHLEINETLLICPKKFEPGCETVDPRITIKKIPQSVLKACQYGKKDYLLPIKECAMEEADEEELPESQE